jgi:hypothetical protein
VLFLSRRSGIYQSALLFLLKAAKQHGMTVPFSLSPTRRATEGLWIIWRHGLSKAKPRNLEAVAVVFSDHHLCNISSKDESDSHSYVVLMCFLLDLASANKYEKKD